MHWQPARRLMVAICAFFIVMLAACNGGGGTSSTAQGGATATVAPTASTTDATATPTVGVGTPTATATPSPSGTNPTATPSQPQTVVYGYTGTDVLTAMDVATRAHIWHRDLGSTPFQPVLANGLLYVYGEPYKLEAYDPHTGAHVWVAPYFSETTPIVTSSLIYNLGFKGNTGGITAYTLTALDAHTGAFKWQQSMNSGGATFFLTNGTLYVPGLQSSTTTIIYSYDATTGTPKTTYTINAPFNNSLEAVTNGVAYFACDWVTMCAASLATQSIIWKYHNGGSEHLVIANGIAYFGSDDNHIYAVNATTGALVWSYKTGGSVQSKAIVVNGNTYFASTDAYYYSFSGSGQLLWRTRMEGGSHYSGQWYNGQIYSSFAGVVCIINPTTGKLTQLISIPAAPFVVAAW